MISAICDDYLCWIRTRECQAMSGSESPCQGGIVAHHVTGRGMGGSKRDDRDVVSLCSGHHGRFHDSGQLWPWDADLTKLHLLASAHYLLKAYLDLLQREEQMTELLQEDIF